MAPPTISNYLGMLQEDPDSVQAVEGLREAIRRHDPQHMGREPIRLLEVARQGHESRGELATVAALIECEIELVHSAGDAQSDPEFEAALWKELGRLSYEDLLDPERAKTAYLRAQELQPDDSDVLEALHRIEQTSDSWAKFAKRFVEEAEQATDLSLKTSLLVRAASLIWQFRSDDRTREVDRLFERALEIDAAHPRAIRLYEQILRADQRWDKLGQVIMAAAEAGRSRDERLQAYVRAGRIFSRKAEDRQSAAAAYEGALGLEPTHAESMAFLAELYTDESQWDALVALYEAALRVRQRIEVEEAILLQIGMVHWRKRQAPDAAEPYFSRLRKIDPAHPAVLDFYRDRYREAEDPTRWLDLLADAQRAADDRERRLSLAIELARTAERSPAMAERCIDAWKLVQRLDPGNRDAPAALKALYRSSEKWNAYVEVLKAELASVDDDDTAAKVELLRELVRVYQNELRLDVMVVNTYSALLELVPDDREALAALAERYEVLGRWSDLITTLSRQADLVEDPAQKVALYLRVSRLWIERLTNHNQAAEPLQKALNIDPHNREALDSLKHIYAKQRDWQALFQLSSHQAEAAESDPTQLDAKREMARLASEKLNDHDRAIALWREVLAADPTAEDALDALERLAERQKNAAVLVEVLEKRLDAAPDVATQGRLLQRLGGLYGEELQNADAAANVWRRVLEIEPRNGRALRMLRDHLTACADWDGLEALYAQLGDWEGLADVLGSAAERAETTEAKVQLSFRAARVYDSQLQAPQRAFRSYERVLAVDPQNLQAAQALVPIYRSDEKWSRLVGVLQIELAHLEASGTPEAQLATLRQLHEILLEQLADGEAAFGFARRAYALAPQDDEVRERLERAAERSASLERLIEIYRERVEQDIDDAERLALRRRIASIALDSLGQTELAVEQLEQVLSADARDFETLGMLERIYRGAQRLPDLCRVLEHKASHASEAATRWQVLQELARLREEALDDPDGAARHYRALLEMEAGHRETLVALDRLATQAQRWEELIEVLQARQDVEAELAVRVDLKLRLGALLADAVGDFDAARAQLADVFELEPGQPQAIAALERLVEKDVAQAEEVWPLLDRAYTEAGRYDKLATLLKTRLENSDDADEQRELRLRLAEISAGALGDAAGAYGELEAAFLAQPDDPSLWERVTEAAERAQQHAALASAFARAIEGATLTDADAAELAARTARLYDVVLGKADEAEPFHKRVLAHDPLDDTAFGALKDLYTKLERWDDLQGLYRERIRQTADATAKLELLLQVCFLFEEILDQPDAAIETYEQILELEPLHDPSQRALERLYERRGRWRDLTTLLARRLDQAEGQEAIELMWRLGELNETKLGDPEAAVDQYESVLERAPTYLRAQRAMERLLSVDSQRQRIAVVMQPLYENQGAYPELARVLEIQLEAAEDRDESVDLLIRLGSLYEQRLQEPQSAFDAFARAVERDPGETRSREAMARLAGRLGRQRERAEVLEQALTATTEPGTLQSELLLELAQVWDQEVGDAAAAERCFERLVAVSEDDPETSLVAARALERLHTAKQDHARLADDLRLQIRHETDDEVQRGLLVRLAELLEVQLEDMPGAIAVHRQRLELDPGDVDAMDALARQLERQGQWAELVEVLQRRAEEISEPEASRAIGHRIGSIHEDLLHDREQAIATYEDLRTRLGPDRKTLAALASLYEATERWEDLLEVVMADLELVEDADVRCEIQARAADLMRTRTGDVERSLELYEAVLAQEASHVGSLAALDAIMQDPASPLREEAARLAAPRHEAQGAYDRLLDCLDVMVETEELADRLEALCRAAVVAEERLEDVTRAFGYVGRALRAAAAEPEAASLLDDLRRLAETSGRYAEYVAILREVAPDIFDGELQVRVYEQIAEVARRELEDSAVALEYYNLIREQDPEHAAALDALAELTEAAGDYGALIEVLQAKTDLASQPRARHALLLRQAEILERGMGDVDAAIDVLEAITTEHDDPEAFAALQRLYTGAERWPELLGLYEQQLERGLGDPTQLHFAAGACQLERLEEPQQAVEHFRAVLERDASHRATIEALEGLMAASEHRGLAAEVLEPVYLANMEWAKLTGTLEARCADELDPEVRKRLLTRLAQIYEDQLEDYPATLEIYARLFREDPRDEGMWETLGRLTKHLDAWARLAEVYDGVLQEEGVVDESLARLAIQTAQLYQRIERLDRAAELYAAVLELDPSQRTAFFGLEAAYLKQREFDSLLELYREQVDIAPTDEDRRELVHKMARIREDAIRDDAGAIEAYREALALNPDDMVAVESLEGLLERTERWQDLADQLRDRIDRTAEGDTAVELRYRLGRLLTDKLQDAEGAIDVYEEIVRVAPQHRPTMQALEVLVQDPEHTLRVTELLEPIYLDQDQWKKRIAIYEAQQELSDDPSERVRLLSEIAHLHAARGADLALAFDALSRAFVIDPTEPELREALEATAGQLGDWDALVSSFEAAIQKCEDPDTVTSLLTDTGRLHDTRRGDLRAAIQLFERLLQHDADDPSPLGALELLHTQLGDWKGLDEVVRRKVEASLDPIDRAELWRKVGSVREQMLEDLPGAIEAYQRAAEEDDADLAAYAALDRLYEAQQDAPHLFDVLKRRLELEEAVQTRIEIAMRLGRLAEEGLHQKVEAIEAYQRVLDEQSDHAEALVALARLYRVEAMWPALLDNLRARADLAESFDARVALLYEAGQVLEKELEDVGEAIETYQQALEVDAAHEPSIQALLGISRQEDYQEQATEMLEPLLAELERWADLAQLVERHAQSQQDPLERSGRWRRLAEIQERGLEDLDAAFTALDRALTDDPSATEVADEIERVGGLLEAWERVADVFGAQASAAQDATEASALYRRLGQIAENKLGDEVRAIEAYRRAVEQIGDDEWLLQRLDELHAKTEQWSELSDVLERRIALAGEPQLRTELQLRLAALREQRFGDGQAALAVYQDVIGENPGNEQALEGLERLLQDRSLAPEVCDVLDGIYRQRGEMQRVAQLIDTRVELAQAPADKVSLLVDGATLWEQDLGDAAQALARVRQALLLDALDDGLVDHLERLAEQAGAWESLRGLFEGLVADSDLSPDRVRELGLRAATWYRQHLNDPAASEGALRTVLKVDAHAPEAHEMLVELLRQTGHDRPQDLVAALWAWADADQALPDQRALLFEAAQLSEERLSDLERATAAYRRVWELDEDDLDAVEALLRLHRAQGRWSEVAELLRRRIERENDPDARKNLRHELASLCVEQLNDRQAAVAVYEALLEEEPEDAQAQDALEAIYERDEQWDALHELLQRRLDHADSSEARCAVRVRLARFAEQQFGRREEAIEQLREILVEQPGHPDALQELERLYRAEGRWEDLAELCWQRVENVAGSGDRAAEIALLVDLAELYLEQLSDEDQAREVYERILSRDESHVGALEALASLHERAEAWDDALASLERLLALQEGEAAQATARRCVTLVRDRLDDPPRLEAALKTAYALDPDSGALRDELKAHYRAQDQMRELADLMADEAARLQDPQQKVAALRELADLWDQTLEDTAAAIECLEQAAALLPDDRSILLPLCDLFVKVGRQQDAISTLERIIASFGGRRAKEVAIYEHRLGQALESLGDRDGALAHYDAAFKIDLTNVLVLRDLGRLSLEHGDLDRAQKTFRALLLQKLTPEAGISKADVYYYLGRISEQQGDKVKAKSMLERALAESRDHSEAQALLSSLQ